MNLKKIRKVRWTLTWISLVLLTINGAMAMEFESENFKIRTTLTPSTRYTTR